MAGVAGCILIGQPGGRAGRALTTDQARPARSCCAAWITRAHQERHRHPAPAGLFFCRWPRSHTLMDPDLENVIRQTLADAQAAGKDYLSQTELAVRAVQRARPDMTASDALAAINLMQRS